MKITHQSVLLLDRPGSRIRCGLCGMSLRTWVPFTHNCPRIAGDRDKPWAPMYRKQEEKENARI